MMGSHRRYPALEKAMTLHTVDQTQPPTQSLQIRRFRSPEPHIINAPDSLTSVWTVHGYPGDNLLKHRSVYVTLEHTVWKTSS